MIQSSSIQYQPSATQSILAPPFVHPSRIDAVRGAKILVVDDDRIIRKVLERMLLSAGFINVHMASNGLEAIDFIEKEEPDLLLLDLFMPNMNGMEVCDKIRHMHLETPPAILVQTGSSEEEHIIKAFHRGAVDYITKPTRDIEMVTRCIAHIERRNLEIERTHDHYRMRSELEHAAKLQYDLLPEKPYIHQVAQQMQLDIASQLTFSSEMGGDLWGMRQLDDSQFSLHTVDVSGHGLKPALHTFRINSLVQDYAAVFKTPDHIMYLLNNKLYRAMPTDQFATMFYMCLDRKDRVLKYSTAGAPLPMIIRKNGEYVRLEGSGLPLGCAADTRYTQHEFKLHKGDTMLIYSDALFEAVPELSERDVVLIIKEHMGSAQELINELMKVISLRIGSQAIQDDLTLIVIKVP